MNCFKVQFEVHLHKNTRVTRSTLSRLLFSSCRCDRSLQLPDHLWKAPGEGSFYPQCTILSAGLRVLDGLLGNKPQPVKMFSTCFCYFTVKYRKNVDDGGARSSFNVCVCFRLRSTITWLSSTTRSKTSLESKWAAKQQLPVVKANKATVFKLSVCCGRARGGGLAAGASRRPCCILEDVGSFISRRSCRADWDKCSFKSNQLNVSPRSCCQLTAHDYWSCGCTRPLSPVLFLLMLSY